LEAAVEGKIGQVRFTPESSFSLTEQTNDLRKKHQDLVKNMLDFLTKVVKNSLHDQEYKQIGRLPKFYNTRDKRSIQRYKLDMWPGYTCAVKCLNDGFFLNVDTATRFIQQSTVLSLLK